MDFLWVGGGGGGSTYGRYLSDFFAMIKLLDHIDRISDCNEIIVSRSLADLQFLYKIFSDLTSKIFTREALRRVF